MKLRTDGILVLVCKSTPLFMCNEARTDDAPPTYMTSSNSASFGPAHVLVVRGLDENADEEMLRCEFSKHAPVKVADATKALEATNGTTLEKNGQILRVAYAKSILGPGFGASSSHSSSLAAAAIEAATFSQ